jgi:anaphase-promoting complex subunit 8
MPIDLTYMYNVHVCVQYALYYFKKAATLKASDARMWCAVGNCYLQLGMRSEAILVLDRAVSCGDSEGIATRELARLYK